MPTEVWVRNPGLCIRECAEVQQTELVFDRGYLVRQKWDPNKMVELHYGTAIDYRILIVGNNEQGTAELRRGHDLDRPVAVYPTWQYGQPIEDLEKMLANPAGDGHLPGDSRIPRVYRPVRGQEHRVVLTDMPNARDGASRSLWPVLAELQEDYPDAIMHLHGMYSYRTNFGLGLRACDVDPREPAKAGKVYLPNGKEVRHERAAQVPQWVNLMGMTPVSLKLPRNRCIYNIESARWAGQYYLSELRFDYRRGRVANPDEPNPKPLTTKSIQMRRQAFRDGDLFLCDLCSRQNSCKFFRTGSVCIVPGSEGEQLANLLGSRDSERIMEGLGALQSAGARRLEQGLDNEQATGKLDPEVTKIIHSLFMNGVRLAKLRDPALAAAGAPKLKLTMNQQQITVSNPKELMAAVMAEMEAKGIPRDQITPEMVQRVISEPEDIRQKAIDVAVSEKAVAHTP